MPELTDNVNWLAVIIGFVLAFALGWLWYSPKLFGRKWAEGVGLDPKGPETMPVAAMAIQAAGTFLLAWLVGITAAHEALFTIILIALTIMMLLAAGGFFTKKSGYAIATEAGFVAAMVVVMIAVQAAL
mgnify:FL=1|jgi:hypothetical protein